MRILALLISTLFPLFAAVAEPTLETSEVFPPGFHGIARYRIPGMVVTPKGTVLAYCEARRNDSSDWGEIEIHLRRSTDGGKTWLPSQHIAHHAERIEGNPRKSTDGDKEQTVNNPVAIVDHEAGAIEFLYCVNYARCFSMRSADDGLTWSKPVEITSAFEPFREKYDWTVIAVGPAHGIQLKSGRLVVPMWLAYGKVGDHKPSASGTIFGDDHGKTWPVNKTLDPGPNAYSDLAVLPDGTVLCLYEKVDSIVCANFNLEWVRRP